MNKIKKYLKNSNPYFLASVAVVGISVVIISALLKEEAPMQDKESVAVEERIELEAEEITVETSEQMTDLEVMEETSAVNEESMENSAETEESADLKMKEDETQAAMSTSEEPKENKEEVNTENVPQLESESEVPEVVETLEVQPEEPDHSKEAELVPEEPDIIPDEGEPTPEVPEVVPDEKEPVPEESVHEHSWIFEFYYQAPTCSNGGLVNEICASCGETQITGGTPTGAHSFEVETVGDCCSVEVVACTECNYREVREKDPANHIDVEDGFCYGCGHSTE